LLAAVIVVAVGVTSPVQEDGAHSAFPDRIRKTEPTTSPTLLDNGNGGSSVIDSHLAQEDSDSHLHAAPHGRKKAEITPLTSRVNQDASRGNESDGTAQKADASSLPTKVRDRSGDARSKRLQSLAGSPHGSAAPSHRASAPVHIGTPGVPSREAADPQPEPRIPAVLASSDPENPLPEEVEKSIDRMAEDFAKKMEESGLTPDDPDYAKLWQQAAEISDREFRARYGKQAWMRLLIEAHRMQGTSTGE